MKKVLKNIIVIILLVTLLSFGTSNIIQTVYAATQNNDRGNIFENVFTFGDNENIIPFILKRYDDMIEKDYVIEEFRKAGMTVTNKDEIQNIIGTGTEIKTSSKTYIALVYGDVDGDGEISAFDAQAAFRHEIRGGKYTLTGVYEIAANVLNNDDVVDTFDAQRILRFSIGSEKVPNILYKEPEYPETPTPTPTPKPTPTPIDPDPPVVDDSIKSIELTNEDGQKTTIAKGNKVQFVLYVNHPQVLSIKYLKSNGAEVTGVQTNIRSTNENTLTAQYSNNKISIIGKEEGTSDIAISDGTEVIGTLEVNIKKEQLKVEPVIGMGKTVEMSLKTTLDEPGRTDLIRKPIGRNIRIYTMFKISKVDNDGKELSKVEDVNTNNINIEININNKYYSNNVLPIISNSEGNTPVAGEDTYLGVTLDRSAVKEELKDGDTGTIRITYNGLQTYKNGNYSEEYPIKILSDEQREDTTVKSIQLTNEAGDIITIQRESRQGLDLYMNHPQSLSVKYLNSSGTPVTDVQTTVNSTNKEVVTAQYSNNTISLIVKKVGSSDITISDDTGVIGTLAVNVYNEQLKVEPVIGMGRPVEMSLKTTVDSGRTDLILDTSNPRSPRVFTMFKLNKVDKKGNELSKLDDANTTNISVELKINGVDYSASIVNKIELSGEDVYLGVALNRSDVKDLLNDGDTGTIKITHNVLQTYKSDNYSDEYAIKILK